MSGRSCLISVHAASAVNDMQQQKGLVTAGAQANASINNATANTGGPTKAHADSTMADVSPASTTQTTSVSTANSTTAAHSKTAAISALPPNGMNNTSAVRHPASGSRVPANATPPRKSTIKLPLPPPGTGIRHNVVVSSQIAATSKGISHGAAAATAVTALPRATPRTASSLKLAAKAKEPTTNAKTKISNEKQQQQQTKQPTRRRKKRRADRDQAPAGSDDDASFSSASSYDSDGSCSSSCSYDSSCTSASRSDLDYSSHSSISFSTTSTQSPQHEQMHDVEAETVSPDLEYAVIAQRKKGLLLSRLSEVSERGTLSVINLARRGLGVNDIALIEQVILGNPKLTVLKLGYNDLGDLGANCIANALCIEGNGTLAHRSLAVLDLSFNDIGDEGCGGLAIKAIAGNYHLRSLFLTGNNIGEKGALTIAGALVHGCYLSRLHLSANKIGPEGIKALATAVAEIDARLQLEEATAGSMAAAMPGMNSHLRQQQHHRMEHLFLGSTCMESAGFFAIPGMLLSNYSLKVLCLTDNNIDDKDMGILAQALTQNKQIPLESIMLSFNQITCAGVEALMNAVWGSPTLREVKLDNNNMADRGAQLCAVILTSIKLEKLDISFNNITTVGLRALMKALSEDSNMRSLGISGIPIDLNAAKAVSFALAYNTGLQTVYMDNVQAGYSAQRHITAGIVSNQRAPLQYLTGFPMCPICQTLGMPALPEDWTNEKVLGFVRLMWRNWRKKRGPPDENDEEEVKGPAPPAAVAAAAKIALASLGSNPSAELYVEPRNLPSYNDYELNDVQSALIPANAALIERTYSGRLQMASASDAEGGDQNGFLEAWTESSAFGRPAIVNYEVSAGSVQQPAPLDNPEQRNRNLRWLRTHFRPLIDVGQLPFNNADMWQLHQYYFSPPYFADDTDSDSKPSATDDDSRKPAFEGRLSPVPTLSPAGRPSSKARVVAPPTTPVSSSSQKPQDREHGISFQALSSAVAAAELTNGSSKRAKDDEDDDEAKQSKETHPSSKKPKSLKPRIAYYPRIRAKLESLGTKPLEQTLSLLRKLKYVENVIFPEHTAYEELDKLRESEHAIRLDVEMILLDLI